MYKKVICSWLVPVQLNKGIEDFTVNEALLFKSLKSLPEVKYDASVASLPFGVSFTDQTAAENVISHPEYWTQHRHASKVILVDLFH